MTDFDKRVSEAADAALEKDVFENGNGFLERPYTRYRLHNGFTNGANWAREILEQELKAMTEKFERNSIAAGQYSLEADAIRLQCEAMAKALKDAIKCIHAEYCSSSHHRCCARATSALDAYSKFKEGG
jgi:hypothetical protein